MREKYETDLTDEQRKVIKPLFVNTRKRKWDKLHSFYRRARLNGLWDKILEHLVKLTRQKAGLSESPTQVLIDSQSVKTTGAVDQKGFDMGRKE